MAVKTRKPTSKQPASRHRVVGGTSRAATLKQAIVTFLEEIETPRRSEAERARAYEQGVKGLEQAVAEDDARYWPEGRPR